MNQVIADVYTSVLHTQLKQYVTWPPGVPVSLGDYGTLKGAIFEKKGNIREKFSITINPEKSDMPIKFEYKSAGTKETRGQLAAGIGPGITGVPVKVKASLKIEFSSENSIYFEAFKCIYQGIGNIAAVGTEILNRFKQKDWDGNFTIVTSLFTAHSTTAIVSQQSGGMIDIQAKSDGVEFIDLADIQAGLHSASQQNIGMNIVAESGYIPLFSLSQVRPRRWWEWLIRRQPSFESIYALYEKQSGFQGVSAELLRNAAVDVSFEGVDLTNRPVEDLFQFIEIP